MRQKLVGILLFIGLLCVSIPTQIFAVTTQDSVVRVGIFDYEAFYGTDAQGAPYGYGYEYLDTLAQYGGFRYEYIYASWLDCLDMLARGEIDLLDSAQKNTQRMEQFLFSEYSTGMSYGELFVRADSTAISYNDFAAMNGLTVGMLAGNSRNDTFFTYALQNDFSMQPQLFQTESSLSAALQSGAVDAVVSSNLRRGSNERSVTRFAPTPFYLIFPADRVQLKAQMDAALEALLLDNPSFNAQLSEKYYPRDSASLAFTREEQELIRNAPVLRVAYHANWSPFSMAPPVGDTPIGIQVDILNLIGRRTGLRFEYLPSQSQEQAAQLVSSGQADLLLGFEATPAKRSELALTATDTFLSVPLCLVGKTSQVDAYATFAVPESSEEMLWLLQGQFPHGVISVLPTAQDCYQAVIRGQADFTLSNVYTALNVIDADKNSPLIIAFVSPAKDYYSFGLDETANPTLIRILNKAIVSLTQGELVSIFSRHTLRSIPDNSIGALIYEHRTAVITAGVLGCALVIGGFLLLRMRQKKQQQLLWRSTYIDSLTGIGNLNLFEQDMRAKLDKHPDTKYVVCRLDIEDLKILNEIHGFETGDKIIQELAMAMNALMIPALDACARIAGDDFIVLKSYTHMEQNQLLLRESERRLCDTLYRAFNCLIKLKFGIYYITDNTESVSSIFEKVSYAHSNCKNTSALSQYHYDDADRQTAIEEKKLESRMEDALAQRQFKMYLQPKYHLLDESLAGAEALVRWINDDNGEIVYPNSFIPLFEKNGFITKLDMHMLEMVCQLIQCWIQAGKDPVTISVNFSRLHLLNPNFTNEICTVVDRYHVPRKYIEIELTESTMFDNEESMFSVLQNLHEQGFTLSMDDFGTGYSSLGLLKNLPVDVIKIDRSFFQNSRYKTRARAVIEHVMQMAKRLNIHTVAEGVEDQESIDMLREMGCEIVQGYYYSKPMPVSEFQLGSIGQPSGAPYVEPQLSLAELGNLALGRVDLGQTTSVFAYRLFQIALRKTLSDIYGEGEMLFALRSVGKLAGKMFAKEMLDTSLPFADFLLLLGEKLLELKIGRLCVERLDLAKCDAVITFSEDVDCSGMAACNKTFCQYDEGFLSGIIREYTHRNCSVTEIDCWGTGAAVCRFEIKTE